MLAGAAGEAVPGSDRRYCSDGGSRRVGTGLAGRVRVDGATLEAVEADGGDYQQRRADKGKRALGIHLDREGTTADHSLSPYSNGLRRRFIEDFVLYLPSSTPETPTKTAQQLSLGWITARHAEFRAPGTGGAGGAASPQLGRSCPVAALRPSGAILTTWTEVGERCTRLGPFVVAFPEWARIVAAPRECALRVGEIAASTTRDVALLDGADSLSAEVASRLR